MSNKTEGTDFVEVTGTGRVTAEADCVRIVVTATAVKDSMREASSAVAATSAVVRDCLAQAGISGADARTEGLRFEPEWRQEGQPQRFAARQTIAIVTRDVAGAGALVSSLVEAAGDGLVVESLAFARDDAAALTSAAREAAFADAREKAGHYATLAGRTLGAVVAIAEGHAASAMPQARALKFTAGAADAGAPQPLEGSGVEVTAEVTVRWTLA